MQDLTNFSEWDFTLSDIMFNFDDIINLDDMKKDLIETLKDIYGYTN